MGSSSKNKLRLDAVVRSRHQLTWNQARSWIETGKIWIDGKPVTDPATPLAPDAPFEVKMNAPKPLAAGRTHAQPLAKSDVVFVDSQVIVVNKRAGLSSVPYEVNDIALEQLVTRHLGQRALVVHRLDRETSGLLVFARTQVAFESLSKQFKQHTVTRRYLALVHGKVTSQTIRSALLENRGDGLRGSIQPDSPLSRDLTKIAITHVKALEHLDAMTLIECRLETGRTHQIRIHLSEAGHPLLGEKAYVREFRGDQIAAPRLMLHAAELGFEHPTKGNRLSWELPLPLEFQEFLRHATL